MIEKGLNKIADQILAFDEASLRNLRGKYLARMNDFDTSKEWERSVIVYFIINSVMTKNALFNQNVLDGKGKKKKQQQQQQKKKSGRLRVID